MLDIEVQGAANVRAKCPGAVLVFIVPPTYEELERRLRGRGTDPEEVIRKRLDRALEEIREVGMYDYLVVNDDVAHAAKELDAIMTATQCKADKRSHIMDAFH